MTRIFPFTARILLFGSLAAPSLASAQGLLLQSGSVIDFEFTSMTLASNLVAPGTQLLESHGFVGSVLFPDFTTTRSLRVELLQFGAVAPFWSDVFNWTLQGAGLPATSFGYAGWGMPWGEHRGTVRLTYLSGSDIELTYFSARQSLFLGEVLIPYEAVLPVPEPSTAGLLLLSGGCLLFTRRFLKRSAGHHGLRQIVEFVRVS